MDIRNLIRQKRTYFDGGMGTLLQSRGLKSGELPELWNLSHPSDLVEIHLEYLKAGADFITANTFGANCLKFDNLEEIITAGIRNAKKAIETMGFVIESIKDEYLFNGDQRTIAYLYKERSTPIKYPRKYNIIKKNPL